MKKNKKTFFLRGLFWEFQFEDAVISLQELVTVDELMF